MPILNVFGFESEPPAKLLQAKLLPIVSPPSESYSLLMLG